ncbi:class I SAM-dependent methyltransferase [Photobacterium sp. CCB-ST2H9]|uniref:class I SAM-dependent methyltransferase n=1 Tax=Photobacterium sp. CCB-ST2H9 TaxID=2912855 RepID=UPI002002C2E9|nr:class I SAM-dependent methyltransferase [Photobacterium sp. CCB-ST2H9]UTM57442.1 class I SAM-dependent methyltransferase [Photobacterium sp. CCB-ST2H9]
MTKSARYHIPAALLQPLWLRSRESLVDNGLIYDPLAAAACQQCHLAPDCLTGNVDRHQLLHATLTLLVDQRVHHFLRRFPNGHVINVGAGLDTRFYRLDNGRCRWLELDCDENLLWRQRLFHRSERYRMRSGSVTDLSWLSQLPTSFSSPVMLVCDQALLQATETEVARFVQRMGCHFNQLELCLVLAGDRCDSTLGQSLGTQTYAHGFDDPTAQLLQWLPWAEVISSHSPLDVSCPRWRPWHRWLSLLSAFRHRLTPVVTHLRF